MTRWRTAASAFGLLLLAWLAFRVVDWAVLHAVVRADPAACEALAHQGACWGVVNEKFRPILLGYYPYESQWRPLTVLGLCLAFAVMTWLSVWRRMSSRAVIAVVTGGLLLMSVLMHGGILGLSEVPFDKWGGLPLTLCLFALSLAISVPIAVGLALARRSSRAWISWPATTFIEVIRGVPLVTLLFMAAFMLPALVPPQHPVPLFWRAMLALVLFSSVYLAEVVRSGLQTVAKEQSEAASILGLTWWQTQQRIVLPQAMRAVLPALVGHAIGLLKDSSLVMIIGLHELTGGLGLSLGGDPVWRPYYLEAYLFVGLIYGLMCLGLSRMGRRLEHNWAKGTH